MKNKKVRIIGLLSCAFLLFVLVGYPQTQHSITIAWNASPTAGVKYDVYRNTSNTGTFTNKIATDVAALSYTDTSGVAGTTYYYEVAANCDATTTCAAGLVGESALSSASIGGTFLGSPSAVPGAPTLTVQ